ncbi:unnamed protein product, partial [Didymodactylos carnosus]
GFGFVTFALCEEADLAREKLHGAVVDVILVDDGIVDEELVLNQTVE